jgi:hypothetical protein
MQHKENGEPGWRFSRDAFCCCRPASFVTVREVVGSLHGLGKAVNLQEE